MSVSTLKSSAEEFNRKIKEFAAKIVPEKLHAFHKFACLFIFTEIINRNPVDTGRSRGNWFCTINAPSDAAEYDNFRDGGSTQDEMLAVVNSAPDFCNIMLSNNIHYILFLEDGGSKQAPAGMVSVAIDTFVYQLRYKNSNKT